MSAHLTPTEVDALRFAVRADRQALSESSRLERVVEQILNDRPTVTSELRARAETFLVQCGAHDAGLPMSCACPDGDPRSVIAGLLDAIEGGTP